MEAFSYHKVNQVEQIKQKVFKTIVNVKDMSTGPLTLDCSGEYNNFYNKFQKICRTQLDLKHSIISKNSLLFLKTKGMYKNIFNIVISNETYVDFFVEIYNKQKGEINSSEDKTQVLKIYQQIMQKCIILIIYDLISKDILNSEFWRSENFKSMVYDNNLERHSIITQLRKYYDEDFINNIDAFLFLNIRKPTSYVHATTAVRALSDVPMQTLMLHQMQAV